MSQNIPPKSDLRVKRTERLIFDALIQCTIHKGFTSVTVSDITLTAGINRATFYRHYKDKYDLLNKYTQTLFSLLEAETTFTLPETVTKNNKHQIPSGLVRIFDHVKEHAEFYRVMWGHNGDLEFTEKIRTYIKKRIRNSLPVNLKTDEKKIDLFITYSANASFGAVLWWLEHDMPYSSEEMLYIINNLETVNLQSLLK